jgi:hypothetical protein
MVVVGRRLVGATPEKAVDQDVQGDNRVDKWFHGTKASCKLLGQFLIAKANRSLARLPPIGKFGDGFPGIHGLAIGFPPFFRRFMVLRQDRAEAVGQQEPVNLGPAGP